MKGKSLLLLLFIFLVIESRSQDKDAYFIYKNNDTVTQVDGVDYLIKLFKLKRSQEKIENKKVNFSFFSTDTENAGGRVLVSSFNATFYLGDKENTKNSTIYLIPYISFNNQFGLELYPTIWLEKNQQNLQLKILNKIKIYSYENIYCFLSVICNSHIFIGVCDQFTIMLI